MTEQNAVTLMADRVVVLVVTIAKFRRPTNPRRCNVHRFHVWRWRGGPNAPSGLKCQCGCLTDPPKERSS